MRKISLLTAFVTVAFVAPASFAAGDGAASGTQTNFASASQTKTRKRASSAKTTTSNSTAPPDTSTGLIKSNGSQVGTSGAPAGNSATITPMSNTGSYSNGTSTPPGNAPGSATGTGSDSGAAHP